MRRVIMWNLVTLDGCFEGAAKWDLSFHDLVWGEELERFGIEQLAGADALLFGRVTYEGMASHWRTAKGRVADIMNAMPKVVFSRTLEVADWNNTRLVHGSAEDEVEALRGQAGKSMFIIGSAELCASLMKRGLIDEFRLCVVPVVLGDGTPLFKPDVGQHRMKLLEARPLATGGTILRFGAQRERS